MRLVTVRTALRIRLVSRCGVSGRCVILALGIAVLLAGCGGGAGGHVSAPRPHRTLRTREQAYVAEAVRAVRSLPGCRFLGTSDFGGARIVTVAPDRALRSELAVLRKPAVSADSLPRSIVGWGHRKQYGRFIRVAATIDGTAFYIIPTASPYRSPRAAPRCVGTLVARVRAEARRIPASIRAQTLVLAAREAVTDRDVLRRETGEGVCLSESGSLGGGACGATASDIRDWGLVVGLGRMAGLVPNGVAKVTVHLPASGKPPIPPTSRSGYHPASTSTFSVVDNLFTTNIANVAQVHGASITWLSANGKVIKTVPAQVDGVDTT
jgi:hypothetical protein